MSATRERGPCIPAMPVPHRGDGSPPISRVFTIATTAVNGPLTYLRFLSSRADAADAEALAVRMQSFEKALASADGSLMFLAPSEGLLLLIHLQWAEAFIAHIIATRF